MEEERSQLNSHLPAVFRDVKLQNNDSPIYIVTDNFEDIHAAIREYEIVNTVAFSKFRCRNTRFNKNYGVPILARLEILMIIFWWSIKIEFWDEKWIEFWDDSLIILVPWTDKTNKKSIRLRYTTKVIPESNLPIVHVGEYVLECRFGPRHKGRVRHL